MDNIEFDLFKNPSKADGNKAEESYHVRICNSQTVSLKGLVERIHNSCSMTPSDIHGVLIALKDEISNALAHGQQVNIDGLCRFRLILGAKESSKCFGKEDAHEIGFKKIKISPYKEFSEKTKKELLPLNKKRGKHSINITEEKMSMIITKYLEENQIITRKKIEEICSVTRYKATLYINKCEHNAQDNIYCFIPLIGHILREGGGCDSIQRLTHILGPFNTKDRVQRGRILTHDTASGRKTDGCLRGERHKHSVQQQSRQHVEQSGENSDKHQQHSQQCARPHTA